jgi:hypothetical protein
MTRRLALNANREGASAGGRSAAQLRAALHCTLFRESYAQARAARRCRRYVVTVYRRACVFVRGADASATGLIPNAEAQPLLLDVVWPTLVTLLGDSLNE